METLFRSKTLNHASESVTIELSPITGDLLRRLWILYTMECSDFTVVEERLRALLYQLQTESGILERIVYKNKNQHRRCPHFKSLLKVRRDINLLNSAGLGDILSVLFPIVDGKKPAQKALFISRVNKNSTCGKFNYLERLLGIARLLAQMAEPILKASIQISFLLAKSFFTGFSVTILALLARLRVLVQQILLDIVVVFNKVSSLSQKKHDVKLTQEGVEAFREFYPTNAHSLMLECVWKEDKFVLVEKKNDSIMKDQALLPPTQSIQYEIVELFDEGTVPDNLEITKNPSATELPSQKQALAFDSNGNECGKDLVLQEIPSVDSTARMNASGTISSFTTSRHLQSQYESRKVAFISVRKPEPSVADNCGSNKKMKLEMQPENAGKSEDPFLSLLIAGSTNKSLF
ncbi:hypothetical protein J5N97_022059 [Dioscorea zingiberensis]|uniref:Nucleolus and neural progenitor protein-like N-terminal domain-containing protein n=1 Tax=Dioscorea zingiberensis TaxID=325984 RepID=A0A9D5HAG4_9LILI|nr:hypothetical protein J5N97_022059 [Dioscorea zingiberensis]